MCLRGEIGIGAGDAKRRAEGVFMTLSKNPLRVRSTKVGSVQGGSDGARETRG